MWSYERLPTAFSLCAEEVEGELWAGKTLNQQEEEEISLFVPEADAEILDNDGDVLHSGYLVHNAWNSYSVRFVIFVLFLQQFLLSKQ